MESKIKSVGILSKNYAAQRLFLNKIQGVKYKDIRFNNIFLWKNTLVWLLYFLGNLKMSSEEFVAKLFYRYKSIIPLNCEILHFFNTINFSKKVKWVISVESAVPWSIDVTRCVESIDCDFSSIKNNVFVENAIRQLAKPECIALLALSECSKNIQIELVNQFPQYQEAILSKLITLYPPQKLFFSNIEEKKIDFNSEILQFIYIGSDFYRKGGRETLLALNTIRKKYKLKLVLISNLHIDERKYILSDDEEIHTEDFIKNNSDWIEFYKGLPNNLVIEKLKESHIAILPTWMDTFAYSVLECQACGTPVISTSLRALTEINNNNVGWLINVPVNRFNNPIHVTEEEKKLFHETLLNGLIEKLEYIFLHRNEIKTKASACLNRIDKDHNPEKYNEKLKRIYENGLILEK